MRVGTKVRRCRDCGWVPGPRVTYPETEKVDWHEHPVVIGALLAHRPEFADVPLVGPRLTQAIAEGA